MRTQGQYNYKRINVFSNHKSKIYINRNKKTLFTKPSSKTNLSTQTHKESFNNFLLNNLFRDKKMYTIKKNNCLMLVI